MWGEVGMNGRPAGLGRLGAAGCAPRAVPGPAGAASREAQLGKRGRSLCVRVRCRFVPPGEPALPWLSPPLAGRCGGAGAERSLRCAAARFA